MNIKQVSLGLIGTAIMAGVFSSCTESKYEDKAKARAVKYLSGDELLKAEIIAQHQTNYDEYNGDAMEYWDSLLTEAKVKEAYVKGQQLVRDRANRVFNREQKFRATLDTILPANVIEKSRNEYAKYSTAEDFIKARDNAPKEVIFTFYNNRVGAAHYWNLITMAAKQREAYEKGMVDEKTKLDSAKTEEKNDPVIKTAFEAFNSNVTRDVIDTNAKIEVYQGLTK